jgi:hypothetical protein
MFIAGPDRPSGTRPVREWLQRFAGVRPTSRLRGRTGWRFIVEEIERADPAETAAKRRRKNRAKTGKADCDLQLDLLLAGKLPESWTPRLTSSSCGRWCAPQGVAG